MIATNNGINKYNTICIADWLMSLIVRNIILHQLVCIKERQHKSCSTNFKVIFEFSEIARATWLKMQLWISRSKKCFYNYQNNTSWFDTERNYGYSGLKLPWNYSTDYFNHCKTAALLVYKLRVSRVEVCDIY